MSGVLLSRVGAMELCGVPQHARRCNERAASLDFRLEPG
jgi:hypothetical protein